MATSETFFGDITPDALTLRLQGSLTATKIYEHKDALVVHLRQTLVPANSIEVSPGGDHDG